MEWFLWSSMSNYWPKEHHNSTHGKDNINVFSKSHRLLEVENFPKTAQEVKNLLAYETMEGRYKNVSMILHVT
eukprot:7042716-Ditylum_brightwellii.AAC.1